MTQPLTDKQIADTWRRKAIHRALKISRLQSTIRAIVDLHNDSPDDNSEWSCGYRAALIDLREVLRVFGHLEAAADDAIAANTDTQP